GIIEHDGGRLPAQFQRDALHGLRRVAHDRLAHSHRAGERDLGDVGTAYELGADDTAAPCDHVQETLREIGLVQRLDQYLGLERAQLAGLYDDRTAGGDSRGEL